MDIDERPLSTVKTSGPNGLAHYHELTEAEVGSAIQRFSRTEVKMLSLAARGYSNKNICQEIGVKASTLRRSLDKPLFHDAFYTVAGYGFSSDTVVALAKSKAIDLVEHLNDVAMMPITEDTKPAQLAVSVNASKELLTIGGIYKNAVQDPTTVNIGQLLVNLKIDDTPQWKR